MLSTTIVTIIAVLGIALSVKSALVLGSSAPWTSAGWWLTVMYFVAVIVKLSVAPALPTVAEYVVLGLLSIAFVIAGVQDERQAEPWWWPVRQSATRAERRTPS